MVNSKIVCLAKGLINMRVSKALFSILILILLVKALEPFVSLKMETLTGTLARAQTKEIEDKFRKEPWFGNMIGLENRVLPPWTSITVKDGMVGCWGRYYIFSNASLPEQIITAGKKILAKPMALVATANGKRIYWNDEPPKIDHAQDGTRATISGDLKGISNSVKFKINVLVEYDGLMIFEISSPDIHKVDSLSIEIPILPEHTLYQHRWSPNWSGHSGKISNTSGIIDRVNFIPYYWVGDNDRGLFWFAESDEMWPNANMKDAIELEKTKGEIVLRLNIIKEQNVFFPDWKFTFGLQATPVKPITENWRKLRIEPGTNANVSIIWPFPTKDSLRYYGYPEASDSIIFSKRVSELHSQGKRAVVYSCLTHLSDQTPEWGSFREYWRMGTSDSTSSDVKAYGANFESISPVGVGWSDFIIWKTNQFMDRHDIDGLYHDNTMPYSSSSSLARVGYKRNGKDQQTFPILGYRNLYKRMYSVLKDRPRQTLSIAHMSGKMNIPVLAFEDAYLDGEHFKERVKDDYLDVLSLDSFRAEYMGRQWGLIPIFLPQFQPPFSDKIEPTRGLMALLMIHDVIIWPLWCNVSVVNQALKALDEFGYENTEFIPYFDKNPPANTGLKDVYISAYRKSNKQALLIIANLGKKEQRGNVCLSARGLGLQSKQLVQWPERTQIQFDTSGCFQITIPSHGYQLVRADED